MDTWLCEADVLTVPILDQVPGVKHAGEDTLSLWYLNLHQSYEWPHSLLSIQHCPHPTGLTIVATRKGSRAAVSHQANLQQLAAIVSHKLFHVASQNMHAVPIMICCICYGIESFSTKSRQIGRAS